MQECPHNCIVCTMCVWCTSAVCVCVWLCVCVHVHVCLCVHMHVRVIASIIDTIDYVTYSIYASIYIGH